MGEVYRAFRADDQYRKQVALKVVRTGQDSGVVIARFKNERQILASLEHPNIARLLDGGTTEKGVPYFVMEFIEGQRITDYCDQRRLSIAERIRLFSQVCAAVHYAHQRLIIHRDIKPDNILVTSEGIPKLLDFGIAKIIAADGADGLSNTTATAFRILTPGYASPEQILGQPMTTASDVYSLGVVLYELLTGRSPYRLPKGAREDIAHAACHGEPQKPSTTVQAGNRKSDSLQAGEVSAVRASSPERLRRQLRGDLDNIVLMALRKEPPRRYASVEQFAEDLRRHLENVPVAARKDTAWYRTSKFVRRHKAGVAAAAMMILLLLCGLIITLREARIARLERSRAERRFNDVRKLANSLMFEIHDSVKDLPGSTPTRKLVINRALEYLDSLAREANGDKDLQRELAAAYDRVGDLQGNNTAANLGDVPGALSAYKKALAIRESDAAANPSDLRARSDLLGDYFRLSFVLADGGDRPGALNVLHKGTPLAQQIATSNPSARAQDMLAGFYWQTGNVLSRENDYPHAIENYRTALSIRLGMAGSAKDSPLYRTHLAGNYMSLAEALGHSDRQDEMIELANKSVQILEELSHLDPTNATLLEYLAESYANRSGILLTHHQLGPALESSLKAQDVFKQLLGADPTNSLARVNSGLATLNTADILVSEGEIPQAMSKIRSALAAFESIEHKNRVELTGQAISYSTLAKTLSLQAEHESSRAKKISDLHESRDWFHKSLQIWEQNPLFSSDVSGVHYSSASERERIQQRIAECDTALARLTNTKSASVHR